MKEPSVRMWITVAIVACGLVCMGWLVGTQGTATGYALHHVTSEETVFLGFLLLTIGVSLLVSAATSFLIVHANTNKSHKRQRKR